MSLKSWWADDAHIIPRVLKDMIYGRVGLYTVEYNPDQEVYIQRLVRMTPKEIRAVYPNALHVTGTKDYCFIDAGAPTWTRAGECGAIELCLYNNNESINNALFYSSKKSWIIDWKMVGLVVIAIVAVVLVYATGLVSL